MKRILARIALVCAITFPLAVAHGQDKPKEPDAPPAPKTAQPDRQALEKRFETTLAKATFVGRWCSVKDGRLGPEREEKYTILGTRKVGGDVWIISARVQYGNKDVTVPIPVQVHWAGDTAVISLTDAAIPNLGTYTARVLVHANTYAGTWSGGGHGGLLSGVIQHESP